LIITFITLAVILLISPGARAIDDQKYVLYFGSSLNADSNPLYCAKEHVY